VITEGSPDPTVVTGVNTTAGLTGPTVDNEHHAEGHKCPPASIVGSPDPMITTTIDGNSVPSTAGLNGPTEDNGHYTTGSADPVVCLMTGNNGVNTTAGLQSPTVDNVHHAAGLNSPAAYSLGTEDWDCGICDKTCGWDAPAVACDDCGKWYHTQCQGITSALYHKMDSGFAWSCLRCGLPNFSSAFFDISKLDCANRFSNLQDESLDSSISSPGQPLAASSPINPKKKAPRKQNSPLRIITINCESVRSQAKQALFCNVIDSTKPDIIIGTESWLDNSIPSSEVFPDNFTVYRKDRYEVENRDVFGPMKDNSSHGGVFIAINSNIVSSGAPEMNTDAEIIWAKVNTAGSKQIYIGSFYRQPRTGLDYLEQIKESLTTLHNKDAMVILGGDFNLPDINWKNVRVNDSSSHASLNQALINMAADHGLEQTVLAPTFESNTLDLLFTNRPAFVNRTEILPGICRHHVVLSEVAVAPTKIKPKPRRIQLHKRANITAMKENMESFKDNFVSQDHSNSTTESLWNTFRKSYLEIIDKHVPSKVITPRHNLPWINGPLRRLCRKRKRMFNNADTETKKLAYRNFNKHVNSEIKKSYFNYLSDLFTPAEESTGWEKNKAWHNFLKNKKRESSGIGSLKEDGKLYTDDTKKADILNKQFFSVFNQDDGTAIPQLGPSPHPTMPDISFSSSGIEKLLHNLKVKKAPGPDGISTRYLKEMANIISPCLRIIFTRSYETGVTPADWKRANICPIFKKGERYKASNYRPVSLTSIVSKIMEHCIVSNLLDHLEEHNILYPYQHGFRRKLSTETQLVTFMDQLTSLVGRGNQVDAVVLDFSKAFDKVCHRRLLHKLTYYGITGKNNKWIEAFLSGRNQQVVVNQESSESLPVSSGVPQGTVLGPVLFLAFINDLPDSVQSEVRLFADDAIIYRTITSQADSELLQKDLRSLETWEADWKMEFNPAKCTSISFTRARNPTVHSYTLHGVTLEASQSVKYLGVHLASNLGWGEQVQSVVSKANRSLGMVRRNLKVAPPQAKAQAYLTLVRPHLEYNCTVWDPHTKNDSDRIEAVQRRAARFCMKDYRRLSSPSEMIIRLGWTELARRREHARLILLYKLCHSLLNINSSLYLTPITRPTRHSHPYSYQRPTSTKNYRALSYFPRTIQQWNGLPANLVTAPSVEAFSARLRASAVPPQQ